jgi:hypothetical protein
MKVYIASVFADKDRVKARCEELNAVGIGTTVRWAYESAPHNCTIKDKPGQYMRETAVFDVEDIVAADVLILTVPTPEQCMNLTPHQLSRGGRHFESGFFYGLMLTEDTSQPREMIILGDRENVFHFLDGTDEAAGYPTIRRFDTWDEAKQYLVGRMEDANAETFVRGRCC